MCPAKNQGLFLRNERRSDLGQLLVTSMSITLTAPLDVGAEFYSTVWKVSKPNFLVAQKRNLSPERGCDLPRIEQKIVPEPNSEACPSNKTRALDTAPSVQHSGTFLLALELFLSFSHFPLSLSGGFGQWHFGASFNPWTE